MSKRCVRRQEWKSVKSKWYHIKKEKQVSIHTYEKETQHLNPYLNWTLSTDTREWYRRENWRFLYWSSTHTDDVFSSNFKQFLIDLLWGWSKIMEFRCACYLVYYVFYYQRPLLLCWMLLKWISGLPLTFDSPFQMFAYDFSRLLPKYRCPVSTVFFAEFLLKANAWSFCGRKGLCILWRYDKMIKAAIRGCFGTLSSLWKASAWVKIYVPVQTAIGTFLLLFLQTIKKMS